VKLTILLIALALFAGCGTYSSTPSTAYSRPYPLRGSPTSSESSLSPENVSGADAYFAEQAAQQARDDAQLAQQQRESNAAQHIMQMSNLSQNEAEGLVHEAMPPDR
jgi:hypothetical protein